MTELRPILATFTATAHSTAEDKLKFFRQFQRFVLSDFKSTLFPKWFYRRLSMTFGHIAHYNQGGFYATFFESLSGKIDFLEQTLAYPCYGDPRFTYSDVERALQAWVREEGILESCRAKYSEAIESAERTELARLKAKYPNALS